MLFTPLQVGSITIPNRIVLAPMTRARASAEHVPNDLMADYYAQRAGGGLLITECTMVMPNTSAFTSEPGIYSAEQVEAWKKITGAVHAKGGHIFMQIWHAGRAAHPALNGGAECISSGSTAIAGEAHTSLGKIAHAVPRELRRDEFQTIVQAFATAAKNAIEAGFDGVEIHAANGYLIDQFLRDGCNQRSDEYGGTFEGRSRLLMQVLDATSATIGASRVGVRLSPLNSYNGMKDSDPIALVTYLAKALSPRKLAYLHMMRSDFLQQQTGDVMTPARAHYDGVLIGNMGYTADEAEKSIADGALDAVAFGTSFLANPDLPARILAHAGLNTPDPSTFYTPGAKGYTDYPLM